MHVCMYVSTYHLRRSEQVWRLPSNGRRRTNPTEWVIEGRAGAPSLPLSSVNPTGYICTWYYAKCLNNICYHFFFEQLPHTRHIRFHLLPIHFSWPILLVVFFITHSILIKVRFLYFLLPYIPGIPQSSTFWKFLNDSLFNCLSSPIDYVWG